MTLDSPLDYQDLLDFLYRAPVGLLQATRAGDIELLNSVSAQLLMPLARGADLENLFSVLEPVLPQLRAMSLAAQGQPDGMVCDSLRLRVAPPRGARPGMVVSFSLLLVEGDRMIAVLMDSTREVERERQRLAQRITDAALSDPLTGLPNREAAQQGLQRALRRIDSVGSRGVGVLMLDVDRFHQLNDAAGSEAANRWLQAIAIQLQRVLTERSRQLCGALGEAPLVARSGEDEFVILFEDVAGPEVLAKFADELLDQLSRPVQTAGQPLRCSFSAGLAVHAGDAPASDRAARTMAVRMLEDAVIALAHARRAGRGRLGLFEPSLRAAARQRAGLEGELRQALAGQQLSLVYQPVVALQRQEGASTLLAVEALLRWTHPRRGPVPPTEFIPVAEESGLIQDIGDFVLRTACSQFLSWRQQLGPRAPQRLAVNLSRAQLRDPDWPARLAALLASLDMPPGCLQLELTETLAAQDETMRVALRDLQSLGVSIALDDFGTGYSSLSSLHQLPVDTVKIDRSFISLAETSPHHRVLISATVMVARSLGMHTVAEGIETPGQASLIREAGCEAAQGYLYSPPLAADALERWLSDREVAGP